MGGALRFLTGEAGRFLTGGRSRFTGPLARFATVLAGLLFEEVFLRDGGLRLTGAFFRAGGGGRLLTGGEVFLLRGSAEVFTFPAVFLRRKFPAP
jgi:hypothetical protein